MPDIFTAQPKKEEEQQAVPPAHAPQVQQTAEVVKEEQPGAEPGHHFSSSLPGADEGKAPGFFSAYCPHPQGIKFLNQEPGEKLLLFLRRHFITNVPWIFFTILFLPLPPIYFAILEITNFRFFPVPSAMTFVLVVFYYLMVFNYALNKFIAWFYHVGIVTPKRLLDLDVDNVLHYHLAETELRDVVDVSYSQKGFFQSFFNFGDVPIQTEAMKANFEFEQTPHPSKVADIVTDLRPQLKGNIHHDA